MPEPIPATGAKPGAEDMFEIFYSPSAVFERRRGGEFGLPLIALVVVATVLMLATKGLMQPVLDAEIATGLSKAAAKMTPEQLEQTKSVIGFMTTAGVPFIFLLTPFLLGGALWLAARAIQLKSSYSVAVMIATFAWYPRLIESVVAALQMALMPNIVATSRLSLSIGVGRFLDGSHPNLATALFGRVDLFTLWATVLIGVGFMVTAKATKAQAMTIGVIAWVVGALPLIYGALKN